MNYIAFSLWGNAPMYRVGIIRNIESVSTYYPGYKVVVWHDKSVEKKFIEKIEELGADTKKFQCTNGMMARFYSLESQDADVVLIRDADSRFSKREVDAVNQWIQSGLKWHVMRDHPHHTMPVMGGMWGHRGSLKISAIEGFKEAASAPTGRDASYNTDQRWMANYLWPLMKKEGVMQHDSCCRHLYSDSIDWKFGMREDRFVGERFDDKDIPDRKGFPLRLNYFSHA